MATDPIETVRFGFATWGFAVALAMAIGCSPAGGGGGGDAGTMGAAGSGGGAGSGSGGTSAGGAGTSGGGPAGAAGTTAGAPGGSGGGAAGGPGGGGTGPGGAGGGAAGQAGSGGRGGTGMAGAGAGGGGAGGRGGTGVAGSAGGGAGTGAAGSGSGGAAARWTCPSGSFTNPFPLAATPSKVTAVPPSDAFNNNRNNFGIVEGPLWMGDALYISEFGGGAVPPSRILRVTEAGAVTIAIADAGSNGLAVDLTGRLLTGNHKFGAITALALPGGAPTHIVETYNGNRFNSPNDMVIRSDGMIYFTDPDYQAPSQRPQSASRVYRVPSGSTTATVVDAGRQQPNGITLSLDEAFLYVGGGDGLWRYPVNTDGTVGTAMRIAQNVGSSDGLGIDCQGNIYATTNNTVAVVSPTGTSLGTITVTGVQSVTNVAFGGADHRTLYITALGSGSQNGLFRVTMPLPGMPY